MEYMINEMHIHYDNIRRHFKIEGNEKFMTHNVICSI
jgi:hypothetical protein